MAKDVKPFLLTRIPPTLQPVSFPVKYWIKQTRNMKKKSLIHVTQMPVKAIKYQVLIHPTQSEEHTANVFQHKSWLGLPQNPPARSFALHDRTCSFPSYSENTYNPPPTLFVNCTLFFSPFLLFPSFCSIFQKLLSFNLFPSLHQ